MRRVVHAVVWVVPALLLAACTDAPQPTAPVAGRRGVVDPPDFTGQLGDPLPGLTESQRLAFARGKEVFSREFTQLAGLGPIFNARSCKGCHGGEEGTLVGGGSPEADFERHFTRLNGDGSCSKLASRGGFVHQDTATHRLFVATGLTTEPFPTSTQHDTAFRSTPDLFGFGLIAAIADASILAHADPNDADGDGISGRAHYNGGVIGRFGRKANENDLFAFNAGALVNEMGITNPDQMAENSIGGDSIPSGVDLAAEPELSSGDLADLDAFVRFLAPPASDSVLDADGTGRTLFGSAGCAKCHTPEFTTGTSDVAALSNKTVRPFSDFLLHDMGPSLADMCLGNAAKSEFRTEPLMGIRFMTRLTGGLVLMHDGLSTTIEQAIQRHGGEAAAARDTFNTLSNAQKNALVSYVHSL